MKLIKSIFAAGVLTLTAATAQAAPTTGLFLTMDGSGSISPTNFTLQVDAYVSSLNTIFTADPSLYGTIAIGGGIFGADYAEYFAVQTIEDAADLMDLTDAIAALDPGRGGINTGATAIGDAVTESAAALLAFETAAGIDLRLLIDVTTDGSNNTGTNPTTASSDAVSDGIDAVNCLGIGAGATCAWVGTSGTDFGTADNFADFEAALTDKLEAETGAEIPVPGTLALLGLGLLGARAAKRRS